LEAQRGGFPCPDNMAIGPIPNGGGYQQPRRISSSPTFVSGQERHDPGVDLVADSAERGCALCHRRVVEGPVKAPRGAGEYRAGFVGVAADRDDVIEGLPYKLIHRFRPVGGNVDSDFRHRRDGFGTNVRRFGAGREHLEPVSSFMAQQAFRHLAAGGISGAEYQHSSL
jgi:hypothetical protein